MSDGRAARISILDLTVDQIERVELELGINVQGWRDAPSVAAVFRAVYMAATGATKAEAGSMSLRELTDRVSLEDDEPDSSGTDAGA